MDSVMPLLYNTTDPYNLMNFSDKAGTTAYYSANMTREDAERIDKLMKKANVSPINTRGIKLGDKKYEVRVAAAETKVIAEVEDEEAGKCKIVSGDF